MRITIALALIACCVAAQAQVHEVNAPTYVRFTIGDADFSNAPDDPLFETVIIDRKQRIALYGDFGQPLGSCTSSWHCLSLPWFTFAVPQHCKHVSSDESWRYGKRHFRIVDQIDRLEKNPKKIKHVIEGLGEDGKRESMAVYSENRGLESFAVIDPTGGHRTLVHYYLSSEKGAVAGGCVRAGLPEKKADSP